MCRGMGVMTPIFCWPLLQHCFETIGKLTRVAVTLPHHGARKSQHTQLQHLLAYHYLHHNNKFATEQTTNNTNQHKQTPTFAGVLLEQTTTSTTQSQSQQQRKTTTSDMEHVVDGGTIDHLHHNGQQPTAHSNTCSHTTFPQSQGSMIR